MKGKEFSSQIFRDGYLKTLFPSCHPKNSTRQLRGKKTRVCTELCDTRDGLLVTRTRPRKDCSVQFPDGSSHRRQPAIGYAFTVKGQIMSPPNSH